MKNQSQIDATANNILKACNAYVMSYDPFKFADQWTQFDKKQCWVSNCIKNRYFLVISYITAEIYLAYPNCLLDINCAHPSSYKFSMNLG